MGFSAACMSAWAIFRPQLIHSTNTTATDDSQSTAVKLKNSGMKEKPAADMQEAHPYNTPGQQTHRPTPGQSGGGNGSGYSAKSGREASSHL